MPFSRHFHTKWHRVMSAYIFIWVAPVGIELTIICPEKWQRLNTKSLLVCPLFPHRPSLLISNLLFNSIDTPTLDMWTQIAWVHTGNIDRERREQGEREEGKRTGYHRKGGWDEQSLWNTFTASVLKLVIKRKDGLEHNKDQVKRARNCDKQNNWK